MHTLSAADWPILQFLSSDPQPIRNLLATHPKGTVYRRLRVLQGGGLVVKRGTEYALTTAGEQAKAEEEAGTLIEGLTNIYPPLREVPTPQHRALLELGLAARVLRQHTDQEERHAGFLLLGPTLTWKTSAGRFLCLAAGADPATCVVDLSTESGKSLWIRRGPTGNIVAQRALLDSPVVVFDEYQFADQAVRRAVAPFLSGRRRVPVENTTLEISPVPVVTLNPRTGDSLAARTGLSVPLLRRLVPCDLGAVQLPDLALEGNRALDAARRAGPLPLQASRDSCETLRPAVVRLLRQALVAEAVGIVDVELVLGLGTGLTAWLPLATAMRQALYNFLLVVETLGWTQPGWLGPLRAFPAGTSPGPVDQRGGGEIPARSGPITALHSIHLYPEQILADNPKEAPGMNPKESLMPPFSIPDSTKAQVIWLSQDARVSVDQAIRLLVEIYRLQQSEGLDFEHLRAIVQLRDECMAIEVSLEDLRQHVELAAALRAHDLSVEDVYTTLSLAEDLTIAGLSLAEGARVANLLHALEEAGVDPTLIDELCRARDHYQALGYTLETIMHLANLAARLERLGLTLEEFAERLTHLDQLRALGLDLHAAEGLAAALRAAGFQGERQDEILRRLVETAGTHLNLVELRAQEENLRAEVERLQAERAESRGSLTRLQDAVARASKEEGDLSRRVDGLKKEAGELATAIGAATALDHFLLGNTRLSDPFWTHLGWLRALKEKLSGVFPRVEEMLTEALQNQICEFFARITTMRQQPSSTPRP